MQKQLGDPEGFPIPPQVTAAAALYRSWWRAYLSGWSMWEPSFHQQSVEAWQALTQEEMLAAIQLLGNTITEA